MQNVNDFDSYIFDQKSIDRLPSMKWASVNLENINGHNIKNISGDIQRLIQMERNKWKPFLIKSLYYAATVVTVGLAIAIIVEGSLAWTRQISVRQIVEGSRVFSLVIFSGLSGLFYDRHRLSIIETRTTVGLETIRKWPNERVIIQNWVNNITNNQDILNQLYERAKELLNSSEENQKIAIEISIRKIEMARELANAKMELIRKLPALSRYVLLT